MAKNKIQIDVNVDDKGTTKKVALGAKQAAEGLDKTAKSARTADRNLKGAAQASANSTKNFSKMSQGMGGLVGIYAGFAAQIFALSAAFNFLKGAADLENLRKSQISFAQSSGLAVKSITTQLRDASNGMLGFQEAAQAAAIGVAKGFSTSQLTEITVGAGKAAAALGRNYQDTFDRLLRGVSKAEPELLDELGITLRLEEATQRYADAIGKTRDELTSTERSQAVFAETMRQLNDTFGDQEALSNPFVKLAKTFEEIQQSITAKVLPPIVKLVDIINNNATAAAAAFAGLAALIILNLTGVGPLVSKMFSSVGSSVKSLASGIGKASGAITSKTASKISDTLETTLYEIEFAEALLEEKIKEAGQSMQSPAKKMVAEGVTSKTVQKIAEGAEVTPQALGKLKKDLDRVQKELEETGETSSRVFAGVSVDSIKKMRVSIDKMGRTSLTTGEKIKKLFAKGVVNSLKATRKAANLASAAVKGIGKGANVAKKGVKGLFNAFKKGTVIVGIILTVIKALDELSKTPVKVIDGFKAFLSSTLKMIQRVLNFILKGINSLLDNAVIRKLLGTKEGEAVISDFTFADDIDAKLDALETRILDFAGTSREELQKIDDATAANRAAEEALEEQRQKVEELKRSYAELGAEINNIVNGISQQKDPSKRVAQIATAIASLPIASAIEKAGDDPELQKALDDMLSNITSGGAFADEFISAVSNKDIEAIKQLQTAAGVYNSSAAALKDASASLRRDIGTGDPLRARVLLQSLLDTAEAGDAAASVFGEEGELSQALNKMAGSDVPSLIEEFTEIEERINGLATKKIRLDIRGVRASTLPQNVQQQRQLNLAAEQANILLQQKKANLDQYISSNRNLTGDALEAHLQEVENRRREILLLQEKAKVAQRNSSEIIQIGDAAANAFESGMVSAFDGIIQGTMSVKEAFFSMAKGVLQALSQIIAKLIAVKIIESAISAFGVSAGSTEALALSGGSTGAGAVSADISSSGLLSNMGPPSNRYGGVVANGKQMPGYAVGGIARGPTAGYPALLHGTEAVVPLPNGKSIPVDMKGAGQNNNVVVNVSIDGGGNTQQNSQSNGQQGSDIGKAIATAVQKELQNQKRSGGILNPYGVA